jgi:hypothetical protein
MKKTPLKRKTPLKAKSKLVAKTPLKSKKGLSKSSTFDSCKVAPASKKNVIANPSASSIKKIIPPPKRKYGLVGHGRSNAHTEYHEQLVRQGCFACNILGKKPTSKLCIHHIRGRNKGKKDDRCEWLVICLCWEHHDPSTLTGGCYESPSVHGNKHLFTEVIGYELWCVYESFRSVGRIPPWLAAVDWSEYLSIEDQNEQWVWILANDRSGAARISDDIGHNEEGHFMAPPSQYEKVPATYPGFSSVH